MDKNRKHFTLGIFSGASIILLILILSTLIPLGSEVTGVTNIAIIDVKGEISFNNSNTSSKTINPDEFNELIEKANSDSNIGAIVLDINSDGGSIVAANQILESMKKSKKPIIAWIGESGTSTAYYIASGSDEIVSDPSSHIGNIGFFLTIDDLLKHYNTNKTNIYSVETGEYKSLLDYYKSLNSDEKILFQKMVNDGYDNFTSVIAKNRGLNISYVKSISNGKVYTGKQALELKLVDKIGGKDSAIKLAAEKAGFNKYEAINYNNKQYTFDLKKQVIQYGIIILKGINNGLKYLGSEINNNIYKK